MGKWYALGLIAVAGMGVLGFLRVVAHEIEAVEKSLEALVAQERLRKDQERAEAA